MKHTLLVLVAIVVPVATSCDPVHHDDISALGDEVAGVQQGPMHRPGQPCLLCHDGAFGDPSAFSVAGTVFEHLEGAVGVDGVTVSLEDSIGSTYTATTNAAGNFYVDASRWQPHYPMTTSITPRSGQPIPMHTLIGWSGACATCHTSAVGPDSAGPVAISLDDGGVPP
jgi:hypothetical protein